MEYKTQNHYRFAPYLYGVSPINGGKIHSLEYDGNKVVVFVRGKRILIEYGEFEVGSDIKLSKEDALKLIDGTKGFIMIGGEFAGLPALFTTSDGVELMEGDYFYYTTNSFIGIGKACSMNSILFASNFPVFGKMDNAVNFIIKNY